ILCVVSLFLFFFFSSRRRHTRSKRDWSSDVCSSDLEAGAAAVIVSNHGGRQLEGARAALDALPEVVTAVGPDFPVLMDGGIRSGRDVLVALALGATAVLIGRPILHGLAVADTAGATAVLTTLIDELVDA